MRVEMEKGIAVLFSVVYLLARAAVMPCHRVGGNSNRGAARAGALGWERLGERAGRTETKATRAS